MKERELKEINHQEYEKKKRKKNIKFFINRKYFPFHFHKTGSKKLSHPSLAAAAAKSGDLNETKLLIAAMNNDYYKVEELCAKGVNINCQSSSPGNLSAVELAIDNGAIDVVALLFKKGAVINSKKAISLEESYYNFATNYESKAEKITALMTDDTLGKCDKHIEEMERKFCEFVELNSIQNLK